jgi:nucleoside-diphosphate-sugar epimerase
MGWLGSRLVETLLEGLPDHPELKEPQRDLRIRCLVLPGQDGVALRKLSDRVEIVTGDIRELENCRKFCALDAKSNGPEEQRWGQGAILFHTAGIIHPRRVAEFYRINVEGTVNLLNAARAAGVRRAVVVSSNSPCGCNPHPDHLFDELSPYRPYMNYGRSKMRMELAVQKISSIQSVMIRPPWFYGPNQPPRQSVFFRMIRDGKAPIVGGGNALRSMCYIDNLCQGLLLAATVERAASQTYWIADKRPYSMNEIVDTVERLLEREFGQKCAHKRLRLPGLASSVAFAMDATLQKLGLYHQKIHVLSEMDKTIACSIGKAEKELGYRPAVELEEGMRRSLRWCKEQGVAL